jgi:hypothetical protein
VVNFEALIDQETQVRAGKRQMKQPLPARLRILVPVALWAIIFICNLLISRAVAQDYNFDLGGGPGFSGESDQ